MAAQTSGYNTTLPAVMWRAVRDVRLATAATEMPAALSLNTCRRRRLPAGAAKPASTARYTNFH